VLGLYSLAIVSKLQIDHSEGEVSEEKITTQTIPNFTGGFGFNTPVGVELNFRFGGEYLEEKINPIYGIKLGYVFSTKRSCIFTF
jgi:hypothetical protein